MVPAILGSNLGRNKTSMNSHQNVEVQHKSGKSSDV